MKSTISEYELAPSLINNLIWIKKNNRIIIAKSNPIPSDNIVNYKNISAYKK